MLKSSFTLKVGPECGEAGFLSGGNGAPRAWQARGMLAASALLGECCPALDRVRCA